MGQQGQPRDRRADQSWSRSVVRVGFAAIRIDPHGRLGAASRSAGNSQCPLT
jgi:hypothetical protein